MRVKLRLITFPIAGKEKISSEDDFTKATGGPIWGHILKCPTRDWLPEINEHLPVELTN